jgi:DNA-binding transcriptional MerR regulator
MLQSEYWISELADLTQVSTRTIRYYIDEGLLPQPEIRGKYAVFTDEYLHRLRLIKYLKDAYLPLKQIKVLLDTLSESQMLGLLTDFEKDPVTALSNLQVRPVLNQAHTVNENALNYIARVRGSVDAFMESSPPQAKSWQRSPNQVSSTQTYRKEEWQRIELEAGVELHIRQPLTSRQRRLVEKIIAIVQNQNLNLREVKKNE